MCVCVGMGEKGVRGEDSDDPDMRGKRELDVPVNRTLCSLCHLLFIHQAALCEIKKEKCFSLYGDNIQQILSPITTSSLSSFNRYGTF